MYRDETEAPTSMVVTGEGLKTMSPDDYEAFISLAGELGLQVTVNYPAKPEPAPAAPNTVSKMESASDLGPFSFSWTALRAWADRCGSYNVSDNALSRLREAFKKQKMSSGITSDDPYGLDGPTRFTVNVDSWTDLRTQLAYTPGIGDLLNNIFSAFVYDSVNLTATVQQNGRNNPYLAYNRSSPII